MLPSGVDAAAAVALVVIAAVPVIGTGAAVAGAAVVAVVAVAVAIAIAAVAAAGPQDSVCSCVGAYDRAGTGRFCIMFDADKPINDIGQCQDDNWRDGSVPGRRAPELGGKSQQGRDLAEAAGRSGAALLLG